MEKQRCPRIGSVEGLKNKSFAPHRYNIVGVFFRPNVKPVFDMTLQNAQYPGLVMSLGMTKPRRQLSFLD